MEAGDDSFGESYKISKLWYQRKYYQKRKVSTILSGKISELFLLKLWTK